MTVSLVIRPEAEVDLERAYRWYESQSPGLGSRFLNSVDSALSLVQDNPLLFPEIYKHVRRALLRRFPYGVFYLSEDERIVILAVLHARRDPADWPPGESK